MSKSSAKKEKEFGQPRPAEASKWQESLHRQDRVGIRYFTCDAEAIIAAVHLAEKHHASNLHDNRTRIGALCHQFVAEMLDLLVACRLEAKEKGDTDSKWFHLPELNGNAKAWWKSDVKEWVQREYE